MPKQEKGADPIRSRTPMLIDLSRIQQNGRMGEPKNLADANAAAAVESANKGGA